MDHARDADLIVNLNLLAGKKSASRALAKNCGHRQAADGSLIAKNLQLASLGQTIERSQINCRQAVFDRNDGACRLRGTVGWFRTAEDRRTLAADRLGLQRARQKN